MEGFSFGIHFQVIYLAGAPSQRRLHQPLPESPVCTEFPTEFTPDNECPGFLNVGQPIVEELPCLRFVAPEDLSADVGIDDGTHLEADRPANFIHEELPVSPRRIQDVPHIIQPEGMNIDLQVSPLKVKD